MNNDTTKTIAAMTRTDFLSEILKSLSGLLPLDGTGRNLLPGNFVAVEDILYGFS